MTNHRDAITGSSLSSSGMTRQRKWAAAVAISELQPTATRAT